MASKVLGPRSAVVVYVGPMDDDDAEPLGDLAGEDYESFAIDEETARERAVEGTELAKKAGFSAEPNSLLASPAWIGIIDAADKVNAPVIVVGSRRLNRLGEDLQGSTSHDLAHHAGRPVLIVPPQKHS